MIDLVKLVKYMLKHVWFPILLGAVGFAGIYYYLGSHTPLTYTASGTMYVSNSNPNLVNYQFTSTNDMDSAVRLIDTYTVVVRSYRVMDVVAERLSADYPGITPEYIARTISMSPVNTTGVVRVSVKTSEAQMSADICNAVMEAAPQEIIRVVGAGSIEVIDYAAVPGSPNGSSAKRNSILAGGAAAFLGFGILALLFLFSKKIADTTGLTNYYTPPVLARIDQKKKKGLLSDDSPTEMLESYSRLRMNLLHLLEEKKSRTVVVTSAVSGDAQPVIAANLAISCTKGGKKVLLIDGDMRKGCLRDVLGYDSQLKGLSDILEGKCTWQETVVKNLNGVADLIPVGTDPLKSTELLGTGTMADLLKQLEKAYDLIIMAMPPVNVVADPLAVSDHAAGCVFTVRKNYSDHREIRKALIASEMTGMDVMGFIFYGRKADQENRGRKKDYQNYYRK